MFDFLQPLLAKLQPSDTANNDGKLSTFSGVFTPTVLTILGAIMYLRLGWVVGNAGVAGAIAIILLAHVITVSTGLAVSSIATNTRVGAGGAFSIISKSLGLEVGGAVGVPLFLAQAISTALYILAFSEGWQRIFPSHSIIIVSIVAFILVFAIAFVSTQFAARTQFIILGIVGLSLVSILLGSFAFAGQEGMVHAPVWIGEFKEKSFWETFAIFFPAVTGIMAGISLSGALRNPRESIPNGVIGSIGLTMLIYLLLVYWLARVALPEDLLANNTIMVDRALWGWTILAGMLGATFSSALGSLVAAPRVMQALAVHGIVPFGGIFSQENEQGEPRQAMLATGGVGFVALLIALSAGGGDALNSVADIITMLFLITYGMLNLVVLTEQTLRMVSFRPTFRIPRFVPFVGLIGCLFVMFLVNPAFSIIALIFVFGLYGYLTNRTLHDEGDDVRSGLFTTIAEWAVKQAREMPSAVERTWKPTILVPLRDTGVLAGSYRFLWALTNPQGSIKTLGIYAPGEEKRLKDLDLLTQAFVTDGIHAETVMLEEADFVNGVRLSTEILRSTFFRPNVLFLHLHAHIDLKEMQRLVDRTVAYKMGIVLLARHAIIEMGREQLINVWISDQGPDWNIVQAQNRDLAILMAYQLTQNWNGHINICMSVRQAEDEPKARTYLQELITLTRMPNSTKILISTSPFKQALVELPRADLSIFGLPPQPDLVFCNEIQATVDASCVFVRDAGTESALA